jgi:hypothetical protein
MSIDINLIMQELIDLKQAVAELQNLDKPEDISAWMRDISDRLAVAENVINTLTGSNTDLYFADSSLPLEITHGLGTYTPFVSIYSDNELAYYRVLVKDQNTIEIDSPSGFIRAGYIGVRR